MALSEDHKHRCGFSVGSPVNYECRNTTFGFESKVRGVFLDLQSEIDQFCLEWNAMAEVKVNEKPVRCESKQYRECSRGCRSWSTVWALRCLFRMR